MRSLRTQCNKCAMRILPCNQKMAQNGNRKLGIAQAALDPLALLEGMAPHPFSCCFGVVMWALGSTCLTFWLQHLMFT